MQSTVCRFAVSLKRYLQEGVFATPSEPGLDEGLFFLNRISLYFCKSMAAPATTESDIWYILDPASSSVTMLVLQQDIVSDVGTLGGHCKQA